MDDEPDKEVAGKQPMRMPKKAAKVRNKAPAPVQITAEQLIREAKERDLEKVEPLARQKFVDNEGSVLVSAAFVCLAVVESQSHL